MLFRSDNGNQYDHIVGVGDDRFDLVLQPPGLGVVLLVLLHCVKAPSLFPKILERKARRDCENSCKRFRLSKNTLPL